MNVPVKANNSMRARGCCFGGSHRPCTCKGLTVSRSHRDIQDSSTAPPHLKVCFLTRRQCVDGESSDAVAKLHLHCIFI